MGVQDNATVREYMKRARLVCVPSVTSSTGDTEGLPIVVYEAMALGVPIVSTFSAGIPEAVAHGETGFLSPERDWVGLAGHITLLLNDEVLWKRMSVAARARVTATFDLKKQNEILEQIYQKIADY